MNREIKFRGKRVDNGKWCYGSLAKHSGRTEILVTYSQNLLDYDLHIVVPETVGQYTGLKDKDGKEICEGDIVLASYGKYKFNCVVRYDAKEMMFALFQYWEENSKWESLSNYTSKYSIKIIGNIHDNPELIK